MRFFKTAVIVALTLAVALFGAYDAHLLVYAAEGVVTTQDKGLITGIVRENNPSLGYLSLYFEDGSGLDPDAFEKLVEQRTFSYGYEISVLRDGQAVSAESIQSGDQVFIKLDEEGFIVRLSAKSYYQPIYGTVHNKSSAGVMIKKENGTYGYYPIHSAIPVYKNGKLGSLSDIKPGERIKLLVQTNGDFMDIAGIELQKNATLVSGIYRGTIESFDTLRDSLLVSGVQEFVNGRWENTQIKGIQSFGFMSDYKARPPKKVSGTVYYATQKAKDGSKKIQSAAYRQKPQYESLLKDNLMNLEGGNLLELENSSSVIGFDSNTLVIKDGKLVDISALNSLDPLKLSLEKPTNLNQYLANVVVSDSVVNQGLTLYRGRIKSVEAEKSVTLESFAQLNGITWAFTNTPKTFDIDLSTTRLFVDGGIGNMRDFNTSYTGQTVYVVAVGTQIKLISTAPYADSPASGRILTLSGGTYDAAGNVLTAPTAVSLTEAMVYNTTTYQWSSSQNITVNIPSNAIVVKQGMVGTTALLKAGDQIKLMRHIQSQNGMIILCD